MKSTKNILFANIILAIALFASVQMCAMEPEKPFSSSEFQSLPTEVKNFIIMALASSHNNIDEAITNIKQMSEVNSELYNIINNMHGFITLVHVLKNRFNIYTTEEIAQKFKTPIAKKYIDLGNKLLGTMIISYGPLFITKATQYINAGADINFNKPESGAGHRNTTVLKKAVHSEEPEKVSFLLQHGATPDQALTSIQYFSINSERYRLIQKILKDAMEKK